jgi:hypothetical protein
MPRKGTLPFWYGNHAYGAGNAAEDEHHRYVYELIHTRIDIRKPMTPAFGANTVAVPGMPRRMPA